MKIDYLYRYKEFKKVLEKELDRLIEGKINQIRIKNMQCDWWGHFQYKGYKFGVCGCAWDGTVSVNLER